MGSVPQPPRGLRLAADFAQEPEGGPAESCLRLDCAAQPRPLPAAGAGTSASASAAATS